MRSASPVSQTADSVATDSARLFGDICDLLQAATHVVSHRTTRMAMSGPSPNDRDQREFSLMSSEKGEAATESILAMTSGWFSLTTQPLQENTSELLWPHPRRPRCWRRVAPSRNGSNTRLRFGRWQPSTLSTRYNSPVFRLD